MTEFYGCLMHQEIVSPEYINGSYNLTINLPCTQWADPKDVIVIAGSMRHYELMKVCAAWLEESGEWNAILPVPKANIFRNGVPKHKRDQFFIAYQQKVRLASAMYVVNVPGEPIGEDTKRDIEFAESIDLPVIYMTPVVQISDPAM